MADGFVAVAKTTEISPGALKVVKVAEMDVMVANIGGKFYAIPNKCTHVGGPLGQGPLKGKVIECPWHHSKFDVTTGEVIQGPAAKPEPELQVKVDGGSIWVKHP